MRLLSERPRAAAYLLAFLTPVFIAAAMVASWPLLEANPVAPFLLAVVICSWFGGLGPGVISLVVSFLIADFLFIDPYYSFGVLDVPTLVRMGTVTAVAAFISIVCELLLRERQRAEESVVTVRRSEEVFRTAMENMLEGCQIIDREWRYVYINGVAAGHGGSTTTELIGQTMTAPFPGINQTEVFAALEECMGKRTAREFENEFVLPDGTARWFQLVIQPFLDGLFILSLDITERKRAVEEIRQRESRFRAVAESASDSILIIDEESRVLYANNATENVFGYSPGELNGKKLTMLMPEVFREQHTAGLKRYERTGVRRLNWGSLEFPGLHKSGRELPLEVSFGEFTSNGKRNFAGIIRDSSQRKFAERALRESEARLSGIIESAMDAVITVDEDQKIILFNSAAERMFLYPREEAIGQPVDRFIPQRFRSEYKGHIESSGTTQLTRRSRAGLDALYGLRADGEEFPIEASISQIEADGRKIYTVILRDVTERALAEERNRRLNDDLELRVADRTAQLEAANSELESFSYSVSHDLRAPLRHINGFSQALLEDYSDKLDDIGKGFLNEVRGASREMAELIDDLLMLARVTRSEMDPQEVDLSSLAWEVIGELRKMEPDRVNAFEVQPDLFAVCDRRLARIVLVNLIGNAWKFTAKVDSTRIEFGQADVRGGPHFFVRDNGAGFDMAYANKLFGAFQRLHSGTEFEGTGIGLATVRRIVTRHGGEVWAEGENGKGAVFYFTLMNNEGTNSHEERRNSAG